MTGARFVEPLTVIVKAGSEVVTRPSLTPITMFENVPLAVCDARTVAHEDLHPNAIRETPEQLTPYTGLMLDFRPDQQWYYYPDMQTDEALIFKLCDSEHGPLRHTVHSAIDDPTSRPDSTPRVSFEVRTIAFFRRERTDQQLVGQWNRFEQRRVHPAQQLGIVR